MEFKIHNKNIGDGYPLFFIAEAGVNHNGSVKLGKQLIDVAIDAGADAVKFQTFKTDNIITPKAPKSSYHIETTGRDEEQTWYELLKTQEMSMDMHIEFLEHCEKNGIIFLSTPYDKDSVDLLEQLDVPAFKIASTDTSNIPLLSYIAAKGRPMILSTAMATMNEVEGAVKAVREQGLEDFAVLQCTGNYPACLSDSNLLVIETYKEKLKCIIGYSDHTPDLINPVAATAIGAKVYEKHFTLDKNLPGPDHRMSLEPKELIQTVKAIRNTEAALGHAEKQVLESEKENRNKLRKSIVANRDINQDEIIQKEMLTIKRPGYGIQPCSLESIFGMKAKKDIPSGTVMTLEMLDVG